MLFDSLPNWQDVNHDSIQQDNLQWMPLPPYALIITSTAGRRGHFPRGPGGSDFSWSDPELS